MSEDRDDPALIALGAAVSDGASIDWGEAEQAAGTVDQQRLVRGLREVAALVSAQRAPQARADPTAGQAPAPRHWRHLVLFEPLGQGAFGTVYRGWDSQLEREVAVKLLPRSRRDGAPLREARHLARVRHPNVVAVHGADQDDSCVGIWMDCIEGRTLGAMVRDSGPLSAREMAGIGIDLCRALSALHAAGLLHRDIKPHNVMREIGGRTVLMDFSGAQPLVAGEGEQVMSGTPVYMAPELFDGAPATAASDVYSLGVLLFFLLAATVPVDGATLEEVRSAHARRARKDLRDLRPDLPEQVIAVIERATAHDPTGRYRAARELERDLAAASGTHVVVTEGPSGPGARSFGAARGVRFGAVGALLVLIAALVGWVGVQDGGTETALQTVGHFELGPPYNSAGWPRLSPDGRHIIFGTNVDGQRRFWLRPLDSPDGRPLLGTTADETPFWSPDGRRIGFFADQKLKLTRLDGGEPEPVTEASFPRGGDWSGDTILFSSHGVIWRVAPDGSRRAAVTRIDEAQGDYHVAWPRFLPDGVRFLYIIRSSNEERTGTYVGSLNGGAPIRLMDAYSRVTYGNGHLLYVREGILFAQPFDARRAELTGSAVKLAARVKAHAEADAAFDVSANGVLIYCPESGQPQTRLLLVDRRGREIQALSGEATLRSPRFSPDGQRVVAERADEGTAADLWTYDVSSRSAVPLTKSPTPDVRPVWSPDGTRIAYSSKRRTNYRVFSRMVDGTGVEEPMAVPPGDVYVEHWSPVDGYLTATVLRNGLWVIPLAPGQKPWQVRADMRAGTSQSEFSADGRWLAYMSEEHGRPEVFVEPFPTTGERWQISRHGGSEPHWRPGELIYLAANGTLVATPIDPRHWRKGTGQRELFAVKVPDPIGTGDYAVSRDGEHFVVNEFVAEAVVPPIHVLVNWTGMLEK